jgi:magnesium chelatase family protein
MLAPGEISRAHNGVLFMDEFPEFNRNVLEALREPMETGVVRIARAGAYADFPARFQLIAAMNPCPCGYLGDEKSDCRCSRDRVVAYRSKISGPLLDRIDLHVEVVRLPTALLRAEEPDAERSGTIASRVAVARGVQLRRAGAPNAWLDVGAVETTCEVDDAGWRLLEHAADRFTLSARAHHRILRVARTIADLAGEKKTAPGHIAEALSLRCLDRRP